jgi:hypothetical protein
MLTGDTEFNKKGFYKFPFYCVENILIDYNALHNLLDEEEPSKAKDDLINQFDFIGWLEENEQKLFNLFIEYATAFKLKLEEKIVAYEVKHLVSSNNGCIDEHKLQNRIKDLRDKAIVKVGTEEYQRTKELILENFVNSSVNKLDIVSGKDYLFPLIKTRFKSIVNTKIPDINFKHRLVKNCDIEKIKECISYVMINPISSTSQP